MGCSSSKAVSRSRPPPGVVDNLAEDIYVEIVGYSTSRDDLLCLRAVSSKFRGAVATVAVAHPASFRESRLVCPCHRTPASGLSPRAVAARAAVFGRGCRVLEFHAPTTAHFREFKKFASFGRLVALRVQMHRRDHAEFLSLCRLAPALLRLGLETRLGEDEEEESLGWTVKFVHGLYSQLSAACPRLEDVDLPPHPHEVYSPAESWAPLFPRLTKLDCGTNASNHALRVDRVVKALEALPDVAHLDFDGVSLGAGDLPRIVDAAGDRLATIDFEDACVPVGDLVDCCARCPRLRRLTLPCTTGCPDLGRRLGDVAAAAPKLAGCIFPEDSYIDDEDLEPFFAGLALTHCEIRLSDYATNAALYCLLNGPSRETLRIFSVEHAPGVTIRGVLAVVMDCPRLSHLRWVASRDSEDLVDDLETIRDVLAPKRFHLPRWPGRRKSKTDVADAEVAIAVFFDVVLRARGGGARIEFY